MKFSTIFSLFFKKQLIMFSKMIEIYLTITLCLFVYVSLMYLSTITGTLNLDLMKYKKLFILCFKCEHINYSNCECHIIRRDQK